MSQIDANILAYDDYVKKNIMENQVVYQQLKEMNLSQMEEIDQLVNAKLNQLFIDWKERNQLSENEQVIIIGYVIQMSIKI